jgi:hypothetical protein
MLPNALAHRCRASDVRIATATSSRHSVEPACSALQGELPQTFQTDIKPYTPKKDRDEQKQQGKTFPTLLTRPLPQQFAMHASQNGNAEDSQYNESPRPDQLVLKGSAELLKEYQIEAACHRDH